MHLTVIAYRPNGDDYCRGCHMGSSDSDFEIYHTVEHDTAAINIARFLCEDKIKALEHDYEIEDYEITVLTDGQEPSELGNEVLVEQIMRAAELRAEELFKEYKIKKEQREDEKRENKEAEQREKDLKQLAKLQEQYKTQ